MTDATHSGADLGTAASAISGLLGDAGESRPSSSEPREDTKQDTQNAESTEHSETEHAQEEQEHSESDSGEQSHDNENESTSDAEIELPQSLDQLAQSMGIEPDKLFNLKAKIKIDGQDGEATLADLIKSYQLEGHINQKSMKLSEQQKAIEAEFHQHKAVLSQKLQQAEAVNQLAMNELMREYNSVDWQELRSIDPAEFSAKQLEFNNRSYAIQQAINDIGLHKQSEQQQMHQQNMQLMQQVLQEQKTALMSKIPEWANEDTRKTEDKDICNYLLAQGFDQNEVKNVIDHRHVILSRKAMLYDKLMQSKPDVNNKVKTLPKFIKAGSVKGKADINAERNQQKFKQLRKSGSVNDAASLLYDLM